MSADAQHQTPPAPGPADDEYRWHTGRKIPSGAKDAVEFIDVHKAFGRNKILRGLNLGLPEGKISMILGPSGTGKSVCIKHMVGLLYPDQGDVLVHGESVPNMPDDNLFKMRQKFGVLFQDGALFGSMNVFDNVCFPLRQHTEKSEEEIGEIVNRRLAEVGLQNAHDKMPNELSGGMRKRAGFARALVLDPDIVLFDEPDSGLDPVRTALLGELIQEIHADMMDEAAKARQPTAGLHADHARHHDRAPCRRAHLRAVEGPHRRVRAGRAAVRLRQPVRAPVPLRRVRRAARHGMTPAARRRNGPDRERSSGVLHRGAALATRRPGLVVALTAVLAVAGLALALRLQPDAGVDTVVGTDSPAYEATQTLRERFGDDPIIVLVRGDLRKLLLTQDLERLLGLEGCIAGNIPRGATPAGGAGGPCARLARTKPVKVVLGPGTFVNTAVLELRAGYEPRVARAQQDGDAAASAARRSARRARAQSPSRRPPRRRRASTGAERARRRARRARRALRPAVGSAARRHGVRVDARLRSRKPAGTPKRKFAYLFPSRGSRPGDTALVQVRLKAGLAEPERKEAIALVRAAVRMAQFQPRNGATYTVTGAPVVASDLTD